MIKNNLGGSLKKVRCSVGFSEIFSIKNYVFNTYVIACLR